MRGPEEEEQYSEGDSGDMFGLGRAPEKMSKADGDPGDEDAGPVQQKAGGDDDDTGDEPDDDTDESDDGDDDEDGDADKDYSEDTEQG